MEPPHGRAHTMQDTKQQTHTLVCMRTAKRKSTLNVPMKASMLNEHNKQAWMSIVLLCDYGVVIQDTIHTTIPVRKHTQHTHKTHTKHTIDKKRWRCATLYIQHRSTPITGVPPAFLHNCIPWYQFHLNSVLVPVPPAALYQFCHLCQPGCQPTSIHLQARPTCIPFTHVPSSFSFGHSSMPHTHTTLPRHPRQSFPWSTHPGKIIPQFFCLIL